MNTQPDKKMLNYEAKMTSPIPANTSNSLQSKVLPMTSEGKCDFEGIIIDNGPEKPPSVLPAYLRYCVFTNTMPKVRPFHQEFSGIENEIQSSMSVATIHMTLRKELMLPLDVDLINQIYS